MMSKQGSAILDNFFDRFRTKYVAENPGVNGNDVERAFLKEIAWAFRFYKMNSVEDMAKIEEIG